MLSRLVKSMVIMAVVLLALAAAADRFLLHLATSALDKEVQDTADLATRPHFEIKGFPFVTQLVSGHLHEVDAHIQGFTTHHLRVADLRVQIRDVHLSLGDVLSGSLSKIAIGQGKALVELTYADLNRYLAKRSISLSYAGPGRVRVTWSGVVNGKKLTVSGTSTVAVVNGDIVVAPGAARTSSGSPFPAGTLRVVVPTKDLPTGVRVSSVDPTASGLLAVAVATSIPGNL